ncbi:MAG: 4Fe-4S dicluster domain-containing protein [Campylobacterales bacterium]|nr:4Fe-4S dicluster domain-containing protein [Campylobacterales bacterium]
MKFELKNSLAPLSALSKIFEHPQTLCYPEVKSETVSGYRGFHINDLSTCIGCANCQDVCMNEAIDMIAIDKDKNPKNNSGCIPRIDYGRCCWCSLCTDVCPPDSLKLESECIWADDDANRFLYQPKDKPC